MTLRRPFLVTAFCLLACGPSAPPPVTDAELHIAIQPSDDFATHAGAFMQASRSLIDGGRCRLADLREWGGWTKSTTHKTAPVYFTYCGGSRVANRLYLDAATGRVFTE